MTLAEDVDLEEYVMCKVCRVARAVDIIDQFRPLGTKKTKVKNLMGAL